VATTEGRTIEQRGIDVVRGLAMDAPNAARSGHQGTAMALAPLGHVLWTRILRYDAADPAWPDRDRFVLSAGHASILLYSYLYLTGQGLSLEDLEAFRRWGSMTPGHPEAGHTPGVEVTTGPLGQGFGNAVGMALAERWLRARFGPELCDHRTYVICSDGDLMEGISHEAASFAGHQRLGRLIAVYDDNHITIDGPTSLTFSDDTAARFRAYGWHVEELGEEADDLDALEAALRRAGEVEDQPSLLVLRSHIASPSPTYTDDHEAHGYALRDDAIAETKAVMGLPDQPFWVPEDVLEHYRAAGRRGAAEHEAWAARLEAWDGDRATWQACLDGRPLDGFEEKLPQWSPGEAVATRTASEKCLAALLEFVPGLVAGAGDLTGNTGVKLADELAMTAEHPGGRQVHFGVREHAMGAALVGMAQHGGTVPVGATFFVFSDYMRPAIRLAALSKARAIFVFSHDSIGVGEDGPTHQPIEQLASLRAMPNLVVIRPADANETSWAWRVALEREGPTALVLTRQAVPTLVGSAERPDGLPRGAYVLADASSREPELVLIGTGSEVSVCIEAAAILEDEGIPTRVVSMPSWELFDAQDPAYQEWVLPPDLPVLAVEAGASLGWHLWADEVVAIDRFGASAPGDELVRRLGFTAELVAQRARDLFEDDTAEE
jgi:transketolase